jgi:AraC-like DNA-binding protein/mannose-6-phosphate isomerase-like protein (cupin superfamily)
MRPRVDQAEIAYLRSSFGERLELMRTSYRQQAFSRHSHDYYTIGVMLEGRGTIWYRGAEHVSAAGDVIVIPPGEIHTGGVGRDAEVLSYLALHAPAELVSAGAAEHGSAACIALESPVIHDPMIAASLRRLGALVDSNDTNDTNDTGAIDTLLFGVVRSLVESPVTRRQPPAAEAGDAPSFVRVAREILESSYADPSHTSLGALARSTGVTPFHLVRQFTESTGLSPHRYLVQTRVRRACEFLARGMPVSIVAASTGFADQSHLTTQFKRHVGMTPAAYRRSCGVQNTKRRE